MNNPVVVSNLFKFHLNYFLNRKVLNKPFVSLLNEGFVKSQHPSAINECPKFFHPTVFTQISLEIANYSNWSWFSTCKIFDTLMAIFILKFKYQCKHTDNISI